MKYPVGSLLVEKKTIKAHTSYNVQKVVAHLDGALLTQHYGFGFDGEVHEEDYHSEPGSRGWREELQRYQENELCTIEETKAELARLETAKAILENEFASVRDQIQEKLAAAAKLAEEATDILVKHNKDYEDMLQECGPLYKALDKGGWRHSTLRCKFG